MEWNPLRALITQTLKSTLEKYIINVDFEALGVTGGAMVLRDLELRKEAFPSRNGIRLSRGFVKELRVYIPWTQLLSASVKVEIRTCEIVLVYDEDSVAKPRTKKAEASDADVEESVSKSSMARPDEERGWLSDTLRAITANATLEVSNLVFKFERNDVVATVSLKSLSAFTCDNQTWERKFQRPSDPFGALFKAVEVGGLTINVEALARQPTNDESLSSPRRHLTFEMPVLKRTDARMRLCIHLNPAAVESPSTQTVVGIKQVVETTQTTSSVSSLPGLFLQRVSSVVSVSSTQSIAGELAAKPKSDPEPLKEPTRRLASDRDPFLGVLENPFDHMSHRSQLVAVSDLWIERLDFSFSEKQVEMLEMIIKPSQVEILSPNADTPKMLPVEPLMAANQGETLPTASVKVSETATSSASWRSWVWQTVGASSGERQLDESDALLMNLFGSVQTASNDYELRVVPNSLSVFGMRIDKASLSLILHPKSSEGPPSLRADDRSSQHTEQTPRTKKVIPVNTPVGVVYVEADEDEEETDRKRRSRKQAHRLVTFAEVIVRGITFQLHHSATADRTGFEVEALLDIQSIDATRWHDIYVDREDDRDDDRRDVFFSWQSYDGEEIESRCSLDHPHQKWSLWAHPRSGTTIPAIRVRCLRLVDNGDESVENDCALASHRLHLDSLLIEGVRRFLPQSLFERKSGQRRPKPKKKRSNAPFSSETLVTMRGFEIGVRSGPDSVCFETSTMTVSALNNSLDCELKIAEIAQRPGNRKLFMVSGLSLKDADSTRHSGAISIGRILIGASPSSVRTCLSCFINVFEGLVDSLPLGLCSSDLLSWIPPPTIRDMVIDQTHIELSVTGVSYIRTLGDNTSHVRIGYLSLSSFSGHPRIVFKTRAHNGYFIEFIIKGDESVEFKSAGWELDVEGVAQCLEFLGQFVLPSSKSSKRTAESGSFLSDFKGVFPSISIDVDPGDIILRSSKPDVVSELRTPLLTVRSRSRDRMASWTVQGSRLIVDGKPVFPHGKAHGSLLLISFPGRPLGVRLEMTLNPVSIELTFDQAETVARYNITRITEGLVKMKRAFERKADEYEPNDGNEPKPSSITKGHDLAIDLDLEFAIESLSVMLLTNQGGMSTASPVTDIPDSLHFGLDYLKVSLEKRSKEFNMFGTLKDVIVSERASSGISWPLLSFLPSGDAAVKLERREREGVIGINLFTAPMDVCARAPSWRVITAFGLLFEQAAAPKVKRKTVRLYVKLDIGAGTTISFPTSSTFADVGVDAIVVRLKRGFFWDPTSSAQRQQGGTFEICRGEFTRTPEGLLPSFALEEIYSTVEPSLSCTVDSSSGKLERLECDAELRIICRDGVRDVTRFRTALAVASARSVLEDYATPEKDVSEVVEMPHRAPIVPDSIPDLRVMLKGISFVVLASLKEASDLTKQDVARLTAKSAVELFSFEVGAFTATVNKSARSADGETLIQPDIQLNHARIWVWHSKLMRCDPLFETGAFTFKDGVVELSSTPIQLALNPDSVGLLADVFVKPKIPAVSKRSNSRGYTAREGSGIAIIRDILGVNVLKVLVPEVKICIALKSDTGPALVIKLQEAFTSLSTLSGMVFDGTFVGLECILPLDFARQDLDETVESVAKRWLLWPKVLGRTTIRVTGEIGKRHVSVDCAKLDVFVGCNPVAVCMAIGKVYADAFGVKQVSTKSGGSTAASKDDKRDFNDEATIVAQNNNSIANGYTGEGDNVILGEFFHMLLDRRLDPSEGQLVFSDVLNRDACRFGEADLAEQYQGESVLVLNDDQKVELGGDTAWAGFRFRFREARKLTAVHIQQPVILEPSLTNFAVQNPALKCQVLLWDTTRQHWCLVTQCSLDTEVNNIRGEDDDSKNHLRSPHDFSDAFADWISKELDNNIHQSVRPSEPITIPVLHASDAEIYWIRWEVPKSPQLNEAQLLAISNSLMNSLTLGTKPWSPPIASISLTLNSTMIYLQHQCYSSRLFEDGKADIAESPPELLALSLPTCQIRALSQANNDTVLIMDATMSILVNRVADFKRSSILDNTRFVLEASMRPFDCPRIELRMGQMFIDMRPESILVASHALRGLLLDFDKNKLSDRIRDLTAKDTKSRTRIAANTVCPCSRMVFINKTDHDICFARIDDPSDVIYIKHGDYVAYSWSSCMCPEAKSMERRLVRFALGDNGRQGTWTEPVDVEKVGLSRRQLSTQAGEGFLGANDSTDFWVGVQLGEPTIQTVVMLHGSDCIINESSLDIEMCAVGADDTTDNELPLIRVPSRRARGSKEKGVSETLIGSRRRGGWMLRCTGASSWSRIIVPSSGSVLVEVPRDSSSSLGPAFVTCRCRQEREEDGTALWNTIEVHSAYIVENNTDLTIKARVRPEHRWESLQYALQTVALNTSPPGPYNEPTGVWLALNPTSAQSENQPIRSESPAPVRSESGYAKILTVGSPEFGSKVAQELLRSISPQPSLPNSPSAKSTPIHQQRTFSASLELSSVSASDHCMTLTLPPGAKVGLDIDPRECHALLISTSDSDGFLQSPLRLHPSMIRRSPGMKWVRQVEATSGVTLTAVASTGEPSACIALQPPFTLSNDTDRTLLYVPVDAEGSWIEGSRPVKIGPGQQHSLYWASSGPSSKVGVAFASLPWMGPESDNLFTLDWSATVMLENDGENLLPIPLQRAQHIAPDADGFFCGWVLQVVITVGKGRVSLSSRLGLMNKSGMDLTLGIRPDNIKGESFAMALTGTDPLRRVSIPSFLFSERKPSTEKEPMVLSALVEFQLHGENQGENAHPSVFVEFPAGIDADSLEPKSHSGSPTVSGRVELGSVVTLLPVSGKGKMPSAQLLRCTFMKDLSGDDSVEGNCVYDAILELETQPRFALSNMTDNMVLDLILADASHSKKYQPSAPVLRIPPQCRIPFDTECLSAMSLDENGYVIRLGSCLQSKSSAQRFFMSNDGRTERARFRFVNASTSGIEILSQKDADNASGGPVGFSQSAHLTPTECVALEWDVFIRATIQQGCTIVEVSNTALDSSPALVCPTVKRLMFKLFSEAVYIKMNGSDRHSGEETEASANGEAQPLGSEPLLLVAVKGTIVGVELKSETADSKDFAANVNLEVKYAQVESLIESCELPIVLCAEHQQLSNYDRDRPVTPPVMRISTALTVQNGVIVSLENLNVFLAPLLLNLEEETLRKWSSTLAPILASIAADWSRLDTNEPPRKPPKAISRRQQQKYLICEKFHISDISILLTLRVAPAIFISIDRTPIRLWSVQTSHVRCTPEHLKTELAANYLADFLLSSPALLGSFEIFGNPTNFVRSVARGIYDLVALPLQEINRGWGPGRVVRGVARGWIGLLRGIADGTLTSVSGFSASVARNLRLSIEAKQEVRNRRASVNEHSFVRSALRGIAGAVVRPVEGAADLVATAAKGVIVSARLRPPPVRIAFNQKPSTFETEIDIDRLIEWKVFANREDRVVRTYSATWQEVLETKEGDLDREGVNFCKVRIAITTEGVYALDPCILHAETDIRLFYPWRAVVSVEESLVRSSLVVIVVRTSEQAHQQVRFILDDPAQRRTLVLDAMLLMKDQKHRRG